MANPDLILYGGKVFPRADQRSGAEAVAVWNGRVTDVGTNDDILGLRARSVETIDLRNRVVIPGMSDCHVHLLWYGLFLRSLDLTGRHSLLEIQRAVGATIKSLRKNDWVIGRGWDQEKLRERRFPSRGDFTRFVSHPILLKRICGHVAVANDLALSKAGIGRDTADPQGGQIGRDPAGELTGVLKEGAIELVERLVPRGEAEVRDALVLAADRLLRLGLTSLHCIVENSLELKVLHQLKNEGRIRQSIYAILPLGLLDKALGMGLVGDSHGRGFCVGGVKVYLDGSLGARTAALLEPYTDDAENLGMLRESSEDLAGIVEKASGSGFQLCVHAIGDRAVEAAVKVFERCSARHGRRALRHRIEHSSLTPLKLIPKMKRAGVVVSAQPRFVYSDSWALQRLGPRRARFLYPFRSLLRAGIPLAFGSDCPTEDPNPFEGIWSAVARPGSTSSQRISVSEALAAYTRGSAFASFSDGELGSLQPGKMADMAVVSQDPFTCRPSQLRDIRVLNTIVAGEIIA